MTDPATDEGRVSTAEQVQANSEVAEDMIVDEEAAKEEERTLTDHLNKKLLSSFLARLDSGDVQFPSNGQPQQQQQQLGDNDDEQEFEDS